MWQQVEIFYSSEAKLEGGEVSFDRENLAKAHPAIRHRVILKAFAAIGLESDVSEERIKAADAIIAKKQGLKTVQFPRGHVLEVAKGRVTMKKS